MQYKDITYPSNKGIDNKIIDKEKDDPDQDCDKRQANVANNKDDQCRNKNVTITNTRRTDIITKKDIKNIKGTDTKCVGNNKTKIVKVVMYVEHVQLTTNIIKRSNHTSRKSVNKTLLSSYLFQIPRNNNQNEAMVVIKIAPLKSSVRHRARIKK